MATSGTFSQIEQWLAAFPESDVEARVKELEKREAALRAQYDKILEELRETASELERGRQLLELKRNWEQIIGNGDRADRGLRGKAAIRKVMGDADADKVWWTIPELHKTLYVNGWAKDENPHTTQVTLSRMYRDGIVVKPSNEDGKYALPERAAAAGFPVRAKVELF